MKLNKYFKYILSLFLIPFLLILWSNFANYQAQSLAGSIDKELAIIAQAWSTASPDRQAELGLADMLLNNAKERSKQQKNVAEELYTNAKSIVEQPKQLGNPAYYSFTIDDQQKPVYFYAIGTGKIAYLFIGETSTPKSPMRLSLDSIYYPMGHHPFIKPALNSRILWQASFTSADRKNDERTYINNAATYLDKPPTINQNNSYTAISFNWSNLEIQDSPTKADVIVELRLYKDSEKSDWYINVDPQGNKVRKEGNQKFLYEVEFPVLPDVVKKTGNSQEDYLVLPYQSGKLVVNPNKNLTKAEKYLYPGKARWQSMLYYQDNNGLNFMVPDAEGYAKTAVAKKGEQGNIELSWIHHPARMGYVNSKFMMLGEKKNVNYAVSLITFKGDWYEGAQIYRNWLTQQNFLRNGVPQKLATNPKVADWVKKMIVSYRTFAPLGITEKGEGLGGPKNQVNQIYNFHRKNLPNYQAQLSIYKWRNLGKQYSQFYDRPEVAPAGKDYIGPYFGAAIAKLKSANLHPAPFIESDLWDTKGTTYKAQKGAKVAIINYDGRVKQTKLGGGSQQTILSVIDTGEDLWISKQQGIMQALLNHAKSDEEEVEGIYFDRALTNGDLNHRNPNTVGGNERGEGWKNLLSGVTNTARSGNGPRSNPEFTIFSEGMADCYLNLNHTYLYFDQDLPFDVAIWGDYSRSYGTEADWPLTDAWPENDWKQGMPFARTLAWGQPIGRFDVDLLGKSQEVTAFLLNMAHYRQANLDYLSTGQMLKPVNINSINWSSPPSPKVPDDQLADVMIPHGVFASPNSNDKSVFFVFVNGTLKDSKATVNFTINPTEYGIPANYKLYRRTVANNTQATISDAVQGSFSGGNLTQQFTINPLEIVTYVAKP